MGFFDLLNRVFPPREVVSHKHHGRNEQCWCGSGRKYKLCHMAADQRKAKRRG